ncbi:MAG: hypothetical protein IK134_05000 [Oscillospiraceae bacterium]|nr:hypothetical protein [Oscillospiraceae bacterium]
MKKAAVAACIAGGVIAAGAALCAVMPGQLMYLYVTKKYPDAGRTIPQFAVCDVPADYLPYTIRGLTISVPADFVLTKTGHGFTGPDGKNAVLVTRNDQTELAEYTDPWEYYHYSEADYRRYFEAVGAPYPDAADARTKLLWYCKDTLMPEDCLHLRGRNCLIFRELAENKHDAWESEETWILPMNGAKAYASYSDYDIVTGKPYCSLLVYPDDCRSDEIFVLIRTEKSTAMQIISSAKLAPAGT